MRILSPRRPLRASEPLSEESLFFLPQKIQQKFVFQKNIQQKKSQQKNIQQKIYKVSKKFSKSEFC
jgi:hypothetical protein